MSSFANRVYAITGGASGMGAATVRELAKRGAGAVWVGDWNTDNFENLNSEVKAINSTTKLYLRKLDVTDSKAVDAWVDELERESGVLHGAVNLAGLPQPPPDLQGALPTLLSETDANFQRIMNVNLNGVFYSTRAEIRAMAKMSRDIPRSVVNIASLASIIHVPGIFAYGTSKAAVAHFSIQVAKDVKRFGIRCNAVSPGNIRTPMTVVFAGGEENLKAASQPGGVFSELIDPSEIAQTIVWLLSDESLRVNGENLLVGESLP